MFLKRSLQKHIQTKNMYVCMYVLTFYKETMFSLFEKGPSVLFATRAHLDFKETQDIF